MLYVFLVGKVPTNMAQQIQDSVTRDFGLRLFSSLEELPEHQNETVAAILLLTTYPDNLEDCIRKIQFGYPTIPIMMLDTEAIDEKTIVKSIKAGAADFISINRLNELADRIEQLQTPLAAQKRSLDFNSLLILENLTDVILIIDGEEGQVVYSNKMIELVLGYKNTEIIGQSFRKLIPVRWPSIDLVHEVRLNGSAIESLEFVHANGNIILMDIIATMIDWNGQVAILTMMRDTTEREHARAALREIEHRLQTVISNAPVVLMVLDHDGTITLAEGQLLEAFNYNADFMVGKKATELFSRIKEFSDDLRDALDGKSSSNEYAIQDRIIQVTLSPVVTTDNHVSVICVGTDRTERENATLAKLAAEQLAIEMEEEQKQLVFQKQFVSLVAHQFRTPLAVISSSSSNLRNYYDRLDETRREQHFDNVFDQVSLLAEMIDDMLIYVERQSGYLSYISELVDVEVLIQDIIQDALDVSKNNLVLLKSSGLNACYLDGKLLRLIATNLIGNAIKYSPMNHTIIVTIEISPESLYLTVVDRGIGIPQEQMEIVFEPFKRAKNARDFRGTGLGLAIVKMAVEAHGGVIALFSKEQVGTYFSVRLPISR